LGAEARTVRIDSHHHLWQYDSLEYPWINEGMSVLRRDDLPADLKVQIGQAGIQRTIAVQARQTLEETRWLLELARAHSFIVGVGGYRR
jgi:L-fuconolactonase